MSKKIFIAFIGILVLLIGFSPVLADYCIDNSTLVTSIISNSTSPFFFNQTCQFGCDTISATCKSDPFVINFSLIGIFIGAVVILTVFYLVIGRLPTPIRFIIWFILFVMELYLLFYLPFPTYLDTQQTIAAGIFEIITVILTAVLMVYSQI